MLIIPSKEIIKNVHFKEGSAYLVGDVTEEQKKIFEEFKKKVEESSKHRYD